MIRITQILCPIDFSEFSRHALDHAAAIARWYEARLTVLHVFPNLPAMDLPPVVMDDSDRERIINSMRRFTSHVPAEVPLDLRLREASFIHWEILEQAREVGADLIVTGGHGRSGFARLLLGSITERVMRAATCPTMVVPRRASDVAPDTPVHVRGILCPVDFSKGSLRALEYAMNMAEEADARLTVLHVVEIPHGLRESGLSPEVDLDTFRATREADSARRLRELIPEEARTYCAVETAVQEGAAYREILKVAGERHADLIVMGVQGRGAIDLMMFGSNTARVTRAATCPVLVVPQA
jgi:nucleotide-binding universal stress UspA family protein